MIQISFPCDCCGSPPVCCCNCNISDTLNMHIVYNGNFSCAYTPLDITMTRTLDSQGNCAWSGTSGVTACASQTFTATLAVVDSIGDGTGICIYTPGLTDSGGGFYTLTPETFQCTPFWQVVAEGPGSGIGCFGCERVRVTITDIGTPGTGCGDGSGGGGSFRLADPAEVMLTDEQVWNMDHLSIDDWERISRAVRTKPCGSCGKS